MNRSEATLAVLADFSKAFDTMNVFKLIPNLHKIGFSKPSTKWIISYLTERFQFVQINDKYSDRLPVLFGVPQGSVLDLLLFNLYVTDMRDNINSNNILQYADDTSFYEHSKVEQLHNCIKKVEDILSELNFWSNASDLLLNPMKLKLMLFSSRRISTRYNLHDCSICQIDHNGIYVERVSEWKILGIKFNDHLEWNSHFQDLVSEVVLSETNTTTKNQTFYTLHFTKTACSKFNSIKIGLL